MPGKDLTLTARAVLVLLAAVTLVLPPAPPQAGARELRASAEV